MIIYGNSLIVGDAQHGKDTLAEILCKENTHLSFESSSHFCARLFIFDMLKEEKSYKTIKECFEDRYNNRKFWHEAIAEYNKIDPAKLALNLLTYFDIYVGMRSPLELTACLKRDLFHQIFWVDAGDRKPRESRDSMKLTFDLIKNHPDRKCTLIYADNSSDDPSHMQFTRIH